VIDRSFLNAGFAGSTWGNLGLWSDAAQDYPAACEALALKLGQRAELIPGCSVLDVGFGYGDQLLLWKQRFGVGPITGIEADAAGITQARHKLQAFNDVSLHLKTDDLNLPPRHFDRVLALDCAYHFEPRSVFFANAWRTMRPGGRLALTDLVLADDTGAAPLKSVAALCQIPRENLLTQHAYRQSLTDLGFSNVRFESLDPQVLSGFGRFAWRLSRRRSRAMLSAGGLKILLTAAIATWLGKRQSVHYVVVSAERPDIRCATASPDAAALSSKGTPGDA
jgi:cyclopropane fatty-acyl-phospholipid synthase-like methyltransferase